MVPEYGLMLSQVCYERYFKTALKDNFSVCSFHNWLQDYFQGNSRCLVSRKFHNSKGVFYLTPDAWYTIFVP